MHISFFLMTFKFYLCGLSAIIISVRNLRCQVSSPASVWRRRDGPCGSFAQVAWSPSAA